MWSTCSSQGRRLGHTSQPALLNPQGDNIPLAVPVPGAREPAAAAHASHPAPLSGGNPGNTLVSHPGGQAQDTTSLGHPEQSIRKAPQLQDPPITPDLAASKCHGPKGQTQTQSRVLGMPHNSPAWPT